MELIKLFEQSTGTAVPIQIAPRREGDTEVVYCDAQRANVELGWVPKYDAFNMCKALAKMVFTFCWEDKFVFD